MVQVYNKGIFAEHYAENYLELLGYEILNRRYKTKYGEIDLIAKKDEVVVFIEVKRRKSDIQAFYALREKQIQRISNSILEFFAQYGECDSRMDLILLEGSKIIEHIENINI